MLKIKFWKAGRGSLGSERIKNNNRVIEKRKHKDTSAFIDSDVLSNVSI